MERIDKTKTTGDDIYLPSAGVFEMERGKIKDWRDYFAMATYTGATKRLAFASRYTRDSI